jgi:hypothetical protein
MQRGNLTAQGAIDSATLNFEQQWTFDNTGNWATFKHDPDGGGWDLEQTRDHNKANEIDEIGATVGLDWVDPVHDKAGNMTTMPQPGLPNTSYTCIYDAWNRLADGLLAQLQGRNDTLHLSAPQPLGPQAIRAASRRRRSDRSWRRRRRRSARE